MRDVVELRIHGVGGATPEGLLGVGSAADTIRVAGDEDAAFFARRAGRRTEGYVWGNLSSSSWLQPAWILLLPFTLVNVAGWMKPLQSSRRFRWADGIAHLLLFLFGLSMTVTYTFWIADIAVEQVTYDWLYYRLSKDQAVHGFLEWIANRFGASEATVAIVIGVIATAVVVAGLFVLTFVTQLRFERAGGPLVPGSEASSITGTRLRNGQGTLADEQFWMRWKDARTLLLWHAAAAAAALLVVGRHALDIAHRDPLTPRLGFPNLFVPLLSAQSGLIVVLFLAVIAAWRWPKGAIQALRMPVPCVLGLMLAWMFFSVTGDRLYGKLKAGQVPVDLRLAIGMALAVLVLGVVALLVWIVIPDRCARDALLTAHPSADAGLGREVNGLTWGVARSAVRRERIARAVPWAGRVFGATALAFFVVVSLPLAHVSVDGLPLAGWVKNRTGALLLFALSSFVVFLVASARRPSDRRLVGILWDVLCFWPRRFHPLAVRPYAERAVPELQGRIRRHVDDGRALILAAHSQGSVIAYAALMQLDDDATRRIALVTYGSPLTALYERFFPGYFARADYAALAARLAAEDAITPWRNFWRSTDYVGRRLFSASAARVGDERVPDPPVEPSVDDRLLADLIASVPDPPPAPWTKLSIHSRYMSEPRVRAWIDDELRDALGAAP